MLLRLSVPDRAEDAGEWLSDPTRRRTVRWALNLVPFAGIAFLWFIGVVRDRIGAFEDRFFSTVFLGSGLLFLALLFAATAVAGGLVESYATVAPGPDVWTFGRAATYAALNVYAVKMAGVFMISTATSPGAPACCRAGSRCSASCSLSGVRGGQQRRAGAAAVPRLGAAGQHEPPARAPRCAPVTAEP